MDEIFIYIIFTISIITSSWHLYEEHQGKLWRYFGAIAGVKIEDGIGRLFFTILLGLTLFSAAIMGILGIKTQGVMPILSLFSLGFLLGARVSDWWNSHFKLQKIYRGNRGFRGNPGYLSSLAYLLEAGLLITILFSFSELWNPKQGWLPITGLFSGLISGGLLFVVVIPIIKFIGRNYASQALRKAWKPNEPIPGWAE